MDQPGVSASLAAGQDKQALVSSRSREPADLAAAAAAAAATTGPPAALTRAGCVS